MSTNRTDIWMKVDAEMDAAFEKWGSEFDNQNTLNDWATYANIYIARATEMGSKANKDYQLKSIVKALGLLSNMALRIANDEVAPRHYD